MKPVLSMTVGDDRSPPFVDADSFCLDIVYLHMDLNVKVSLMFSVLPFSNSMNRSTLRGGSSRGTDIFSSTLKIRSKKSAVIRERSLTGIGLKVLSARLHIRETSSS